MEYRVEKKYLVTDQDLAVLAGRLKAVMPLDAHQQGDCYEIRSVYFDDAWDRCMDENEAGVDLRQKFRLRSYGPDFSLFHLEIKEKAAGLTKKQSCTLSGEEARQLLDGTLPLKMDHRKALNLLQLQARKDLMRPKALIAYERTAYVYPVGNVRVTFDRNICASRAYSEFLEPSFSGTVPVLPAGKHILEVKYDELLPDVLRELLGLGKLSPVAFSKYYLGRMAVLGQFPLAL